MVGKEKLVLGLLASVFAFLPISAGNTVIGSFNAEATPSASNNSEANIKIEGNNKTAIIEKTIGLGEATETKQLSGIKDTATKGENTSTDAAKANPQPAGMSDALFKEKVTEVLTKHPEIIVASLQKFQQNQMNVQQEKLEASLMKFQSEISKDSGAIVLGKRDAEVKLVVFLDPNCPHCKSFTQALSEVRKNFPNVAILVRHWPFLKNSEGVSRGLLAISQQGLDKFEAVAREIAASEESYSLSKLLNWVKDHKLDVAKFEKDVNSQATLQMIQDTKKLAENIGLEGTPTSLLIDKKGIHHVVPTDEKSLEGILKGASAAAGTAPTTA